MNFSVFRKKGTKKQKAQLKNVGSRLNQALASLASEEAEAPKVRGK